MQTFSNFSWIFSQISKTYSSVATKTLSLELIKDKQNMTHDEFLLNIKQMAAEIPFLQTILTYEQLFTLVPFQNFIISQQELKKIIDEHQRLGAGGNAQVFLAIDYINDYQIAMKIMNDVDESRQESYIKECINQYNLQQINKDLILNIKSKVFINFINYKATFQLPLELAEFSLFDYLQQYEINKGTYKYFFNLFIDLLILLHENSYAHRDIKPHNILYVKNIGWKLADFGESIKYEGSKGTYRVQGTTAFMPKDVKRQIYTNKEIIQDLFYNDIYSVVCTLVLIKNPKFNSKDLIQFMENHSLDYSQLLQISHPNQLKALRFQSQTFLQFNIIRKNQEKLIQYDLMYVLLVSYYDEQPFLKEKIIIFINQELDKLKNNNFQYQQVMVLLSILHPFQFELICDSNQNFFINTKNFIDALVYPTTHVQILSIYLKSITNYQIQSHLIKYIISSHKILELLLVINEYLDEFPISFCKKLLDMAGSYICDRDQIDSTTIIIYNEIYKSVLGKDPEILQLKKLQPYMQNQQNYQSENGQIDDFNYDFYVNQNKNYLENQNNINLVLLFEPLIQYKIDQKTNDKLMVYISQQLNQMAFKDQTKYQKLSQIVKYHLIRGGARLYMKDIEIIIKGVIKLFLYYDHFFDLLDLLYYFDSFMILNESNVQLILFMKIQNLVLKLNIQSNFTKQFSIDRLIQLKDSQLEFSDFCQIAQIYLIAVQQIQICENQKIQQQFQEIYQLENTFFSGFSQLIKSKTQIIYQYKILIFTSAQIVEVLEHQKYQLQKYLRTLIMLLIKYLYTDNFDLEYILLKLNQVKLRQYDNTLLYFYFECKQYQRITLLLKEWLLCPKIKVLNKDMLQLIAKTKLMKLNLHLPNDINQKYRYLFDVRQHLFAIKVGPSLKKRIKVDNLNLREQYMSFR
ncbi:hypothetical protein pb186bvf_009435 [Paramecium bursaria]